MVTSRGMDGSSNSYTTTGDRQKTFEKAGDACPDAESAGGVDGQQALRR